MSPRRRGHCANVPMPMSLSWSPQSLHSPPTAHIHKAQRRTHTHTHTHKPKHRHRHKHKHKHVDRTEPTPRRCRNRQDTTGCHVLHQIQKNKQICDKQCPMPPPHTILGQPTAAHPRKRCCINASECLLLRDRDEGLGLVVFVLGGLEGAILLLAEVLLEAGGLLSSEFRLQMRCKDSAPCTRLVGRSRDGDEPSEHRHGQYCKKYGREGKCSSAVIGGG